MSLEVDTPLSKNKTDLAIIALVATIALATIAGLFSLYIFPLKAESEAMEAEIEAKKAESEAMEAEIEAMEAQIEAMKAQSEAMKAQSEAIKASCAFLKDYTKHLGALRSTQSSDNVHESLLYMINLMQTSSNTDKVNRFTEIVRDQQKIIDNPFMNEIRLLVEKISATAFMNGFMKNCGLHLGVSDKKISLIEQNFNDFLWINKSFEANKQMQSFLEKGQLISQNIDQGQQAINQLSREELRNVIIAEGCSILKSTCRQQIAYKEGLTFLKNLQERVRNVINLSLSKFVMKLTQYNPTTQWNTEVISSEIDRIQKKLIDDLLAEEDMQRPKPRNSRKSDSKQGASEVQVRPLDKQNPRNPKAAAAATSKTTPLSQEPKKEKSQVTKASPAGIAPPGSPQDRKDGFIYIRPTEKKSLKINSTDPLLVNNHVQRWWNLNPASYTNAVQKFPDITAQGNPRYQQMNNKQIEEQISWHCIPELDVLFSNRWFKDQYAMQHGSYYLLNAELKIEDTNYFGIVSVGIRESEIFHAFFHTEQQIHQNPNWFNTTTESYRQKLQRIQTAFETAPRRVTLTAQNNIQVHPDCVTVNFSLPITPNKTQKITFFCK